MAVLTTSIIDLECCSLLGRDGQSCLREFAQADVVYFKHCKRSCLIELWSVTEIRIREIAEERKLQIKGRDAAIRELILEARKLCSDIQVKEKLEQAESILKQKFIECPNYLSATLKMSRLGKRERKDWNTFFDIFRIMRNSVHNNFICTETRALQCRGFKKDFVEGQPLKVELNDLRKIVEKLLEFFDAIES